MDCVANSSCFCCGGLNLFEYFDLGCTPLANSYPSEVGPIERYPLRVAACMDCYHSQLSESVNPDLMFRNYLYVSGTSNTLREYFNWFADYVEYKLASAAVGRSLLEIACNDGSLLEVFKDKGWNVLGVDPALNLRKITESKGLSVIADYWSDKTAAQIVGGVDVIVAQNVLGHLPNPRRFLELCTSVLSEDGVIYVQTSQADMVDNLEFDTIYHEHHSFFSANSMRVLAERAGLKIIDVKKVPVHGTSYLFALSKADCHSSVLFELVEQERAYGRYDVKTYKDFAFRVENCVNKFLSVIESHRRQGRKIVGYGAAAKGSSFISYSKLKVDYVVDDNPLKWGHYMPDGDAKILDPINLNRESGPVTVVIFAWNFFREICSRIDEILDAKSEAHRFYYITYFPELRLVSAREYC